MSLSIHRLKSVLRYEPETGLFFWRKTLGSKGVAGSEAGTDSHGYLAIRIDKKLYLAHRLAWFYVNCEWPSILDHKDRDRRNNRITNLRLATHSENKANRSAPSNNSSGIKGVSFNKQMRKWQASICKQYKQNHLGFFSSKEGAAEAYRTAAVKLFGEFAAP